MKTYKKHKFIPMKKISQIIGHGEKKVNLFVHPTKEESIADLTPLVKVSQFYRTGFGQYSIEGVEDWYFELKYENPDYDPNLEYDEENTNSHEGYKLRIHRPLSELTDYLGECLGMPMKKPKTIKPIYSFVNSYTKEVVNDEILPVGETFESESIGILVKY